MLGDTTQGTDTSTSGDQASGAPTTGVTGSTSSTGGPGGGSTDGTSGDHHITTSEAGSTGTINTSSTTSADDTDTDHDTVECDVVAQDCPEGQKCAPYRERGPDGTKCVPVTGAGQVGDPCLAPEGQFGGFDDCAKGFLCWNVDEQNVGTCFELCSGAWDALSCMDEEGFFCGVSADSTFILCFPSCDPLAQDCPNAQVCVPLGARLTCALDVSGAEGQLFDPCEFINACDPGLFCNAPEAASGCPQNATGCCLPYCDLSDPDPGCPGAQQVCIPFFEEGTAPELCKDLGVCSVVP